MKPQCGDSTPPGGGGYNEGQRYRKHQTDVNVSFLPPARPGLESWVLKISTRGAKDVLKGADNWYDGTSFLLPYFKDSRESKPKITHLQILLYSVLYVCPQI